MNKISKFLKNADSVSVPTQKADSEKAFYLFMSFVQALGYNYDFFVGDIVRFKSDIGFEGPSETFVVYGIVITESFEIKYLIKNKYRLLIAYPMEIVKVQEDKV